MVALALHRLPACQAGIGCRQGPSCKSIHNEELPARYTQAGVVLLRLLPPHATHVDCTQCQVQLVLPSYMSNHQPPDTPYTATPDVCMPAVRALLAVPAGVGITVVGGSGYGSGGEVDDIAGIDVVKQGTGSLNLDNDTGIPKGGVLPWGYNSAACVCGNQMWFAVPIAAPTTEVPTTVTPPPEFWYASWLSVAEL